MNAFIFLRCRMMTGVRMIMKRQKRSAYGKIVRIPNAYKHPEIMAHGAARNIPILLPYDAASRIDSSLSSGVRFLDISRMSLPDRSVFRPQQIKNNGIWASKKQNISCRSSVYEKIKALTYMMSAKIHRMMCFIFFVFTLISLANVWKKPRDVCFRRDDERHQRRLAWRVRFLFHAHLFWQDYRMNRILISHPVDPVILSEILPVWFLGVSWFMFFMQSNSI